MFLIGDALDTSAALSLIYLITCHSLLKKKVGLKLRFHMFLNLHLGGKKKHFTFGISFLATVLNTNHFIFEIVEMFLTKTIRKTLEP